jgi:hypothetical protein
VGGHRKASLSTAAACRQRGLYNPD